MNEEVPFPPALPAVVPSPIGPAISYSNIRAVTSRAQSTLDQLERKIKKKIQNGLNDAGMVGARIETKIRDGIQSRLAPHEQLYNEIDDFIHNQIAGNLAPAVATLEDLQGQLGESQRVTPTTGTAGDGSPVAVLNQPQEVKPLTQAPSSRAVGLARQLQRATAQVVGGPPINPFVQPCANPPDAAITAAQNAMVAYSVAHPNPPLPIAFHYYLDPNCCVFTLGEGQEASPLRKCSIDLGIVTMTASDAPVVLALIVDALRKNGVPAATGDCTASCAPIGGVDCTKTPLDPACPPDCKTHPEDPRCPPTPPTCPPPCIEVTCPPPVINVPPCPPLTPTGCIQIDLCDWDKFCKFLTDCLVKSKEDCALDNDTAYTFKDCDGQFGEAQKEFLAGASSSLLGANTIDDLATAGMSLSTGISPDEYGLDVPY
jgi:hypothetical protein